MIDSLLAVRHLNRALVFASLQFALNKDVTAGREPFRQLSESFAKPICYVESNRPLKQRNTLGMLPFFLKLVSFLGGCRCM
jgi:hypothetical protein